MILPSGAQRIRVFVVDDHAVFREALRSLLEAEPDFHVIGEAADGIGALAPVMTLCPNVVLMDFAMPRGGGDPAPNAPNSRSAAVRSRTDRRPIQ